MTSWDQLSAIPTVRAVLGCEWGRRVGFTDDREPCVRKATQVVVLHDVQDVLGRGVDSETAVKVCDVHVEAINTVTTDTADRKAR